MEHITLYIGNGCWMMKTDSSEVMRLFGGDTLPTAFMSSCPAEIVIAEIKRLNPDAIIVNELT